MESEHLSPEITLESLNSVNKIPDLNLTPEEPEVTSKEREVIDLTSATSSPPPPPPPSQVEPLLTICPMTGLPMMIRSLRQSDVRCAGRLSLKRSWVDLWFLPALTRNTVQKIHSADGMLLNVKDGDTSSDHIVRVKYWGSVNTIVLLTHWYHSFVKRRELKKGDRIALTWDYAFFTFIFRVLKRAD